MLVSFVIPTRNHARFIRRAIDSCLAQRLAAVEVIVVDGASTDGTPAVLADYGERIRWVSEPDEGQSDALNKGVAMARGEIVAWLNSDDYYPHPDVLPEVVGRFEADLRLDIVYGDGQMVTEEGQPFRIHRGGPVGSLKRLITYPGVFVMQPAVFFRRGLFLELGGVRKDLHLAMDYDLWLRMFPRARRTEYVPRVLACATYHRQAKTVRQMDPQARELIRLKRQYAPQFGVKGLDRLRLGLGIWQFKVYLWAVRLGLRRLS